MGSPIDRALDRLAAGTTIVGLALAPRAFGDEVDVELADLAAAVVQPALERALRRRGEGDLEAAHFGVADPMSRPARSAPTAVPTGLGEPGHHARGLAGRQRRSSSPSTAQRPRSLGEFGLDPGRLFVMLFRPSSGASSSRGGGSTTRWSGTGTTAGAGRAGPTTRSGADGWPTAACSTTSARGRSTPTPDSGRHHLGDDGGILVLPGNAARASRRARGPRAGGRPAGGSSRASAPSRTSCAAGSYRGPGTRARSSRRRRPRRAPTRRRGPGARARRRARSSDRRGTGTRIGGAETGARARGACRVRGCPASTSASRGTWPRIRRAALSAHAAIA